jgi:hypothetical protein
MDTHSLNILHVQDSQVDRTASDRANMQVHSLMLDTLQTPMLYRQAF